MAPGGCQAHQQDPVEQFIAQAIVRQLVDVLGGQIAVASESTGTTFTVSLPRRDQRVGLGAKPAGRRDSG